MQACPKVLKVGGAIALEPTKSRGAKRRSMYLNLEILGGYSPSSPPVRAGLHLFYLTTCRLRRSSHRSQNWSSPPSPAPTPPVFYPKLAFFRLPRSEAVSRNRFYSSPSLLPKFIFKVFCFWFKLVQINANLPISIKSTKSIKLINCSCCFIFVGVLTSFINLYSIKPIKPIKSIKSPVFLSFKREKNPMRQSRTEKFFQSCLLLQQ